LRPASARRARRGSKPPIPFKLFELVEGAVIEARGEPGEMLVARVSIATPTGRRFLFRTAASADASGVARVRVPYSTDATTLARAMGPYTVRIDLASWTLLVPDPTVRSGGLIRVPPAAEEEMPSEISPGPDE
jgi:hypothetical protein